MRSGRSLPLALRLSLLLPFSSSYPPVFLHSFSSHLFPFCLFLLLVLASSSCPPFFHLSVFSSVPPLFLSPFSPSLPHLLSSLISSFLTFPIRILSRPPFLSPPSFPPRLFPLPSFLALFSISPFYRAIIKRHVILNVSRRRNKSRIAKEREKRCEWKQG